MEPQSHARGIQPVLTSAPARVRRPRPRPLLAGGLRGSAPAVPGGRGERVHFPRVESHDRFRCGPWARRGKVGAGRGFAPAGRAVTAPAGFYLAPGTEEPPPPGVPVVRTWSARPRLGCPPVSVTYVPGLPCGRTWVCSLGQWRRRRHSTRPVLKHGPRSLACARVKGSYETLGRSESEGRLGLAQVGSAVRTSTLRRWRTTGPPRPRCRWGGA